VDGHFVLASTLASVEDEKGHLTPPTSDHSYPQVLQVNHQIIERTRCFTDTLRRF
jgi:hypothetical protein